jgi:hypothetical protein
MQYILQSNRIRYLRRRTSMGFAIMVAASQSVLKITLRTVAIQLWLQQNCGAVMLSLCITGL